MEKEKKKAKASFTKIAWNSFNHRRKQKGLKPISYEKWVEMKKEGFTDSAGRFNPRIAPAIARMEKKFGKIIYKEKQKCIRCGKKKFLYEFVARYDQANAGIQTYCRECERLRIKNYTKEG
jgi:hypothetical protein